MVALIIALACGLALSRRRQRRRLGLALAPAWADGLKVGAIAATAAGFVLVLNQAHGVPLPVLIRWRCLAYSHGSPARRCSAATSTRWAATSRPAGCPA